MSVMFGPYTHYLSKLYSIFACAYTTPLIFHKQSVTYCSNTAVASTAALLHDFGTAVLVSGIIALLVNTGTEAMVIHNNQILSQLGYSLLATALLELNYFK